MATSHEKFHEAFIPLAEEYGTGINAGDSKVGNRAYRKLKALLQLADSATRMAVLPSLCKHENVSVRIWAATYLLDLDESLASSTLSDCMLHHAPIGLIAEISLDKWKSGNLEL